MARLAQTLGLTEIQTEIVANVRSFVDKQIIPNAQELEHADEYPQAIVDGMGEMGAVRPDDPPRSTAASVNRC